MALYTYSTKDRSRSVVRSYPIGTQPQKVREDGVTLYRDIGADMPNTSIPACWPQKSFAAGVHPKAIGKAMALDRKLGVEARYDKRGAVEFRDQGHKNLFMKAHGMADYNAGYRDVAPGQSARWKDQPKPETSD